jgi:hypothetical protein
MVIVPDDLQGIVAHKLNGGDSVGSHRAKHNEVGIVLRTHEFVPAAAHGTRAGFAESIQWKLAYRMAVLPLNP